MRLPFIPTGQRYDFLPKGQGAGGLVPYVIAIMTFLTALALAGGIALASAAGGIAGDLGRTATVQIIQANPERAAPQLRAVVAALRREPGVASARQLSPADMRRLLEPWLGAGNVTADLPIPAVVDVRLRPGADAVAIDRRLHSVAPDARLDEHGRWLSPLLGLVHSLQWVAAAIVLLVTAAMVAVVTLGVRSGLGIYQPTIELLHLMGTEDAAIARVFQHRYLGYGLAGGLAGVACAFGVLVMIGLLAGRMGAGAIGALSLPWAGWAALAVLPLAVALLAMVAARVSVARALRAQL
ncbi:MAG: cell division protein [Sphingomonadaceae bacterium]|nr:cell division protein [Sphingomonadaceae bacterium]